MLALTVICHLPPAIFLPPLLQALCNHFHAIVVKTHAIDQGLVFGKAKKTRLFISLLWSRCNRSNFNKAKTQCFQFTQVFCIFIKTGTQPDPVGKPETKRSER